MNTEPSIASVIPAATQETVSKALAADFKSTLKLPKGFNKYLIARAIDRVILEKVPVEGLKMGLLASERAYITAVVEEFRGWEKANKTEEKKS